MSEEDTSVSSQLMAALPSETVLRQRRSAGRAPNGAGEQRQDQDRDRNRNQGGDTDRDIDKATNMDKDGEKEKKEDGKDAEQERTRTRPAAQVVPPDSDRDRWADDTDLSSLTDQVRVKGRVRSGVGQVKGCDSGQGTGPVWEMGQGCARSRVRVYVSGHGQFRVRVVSVQGQGYVSGQVWERIRLGQQGREAELETSRIS